MIPASTLAMLVAERIGAGESCPPGTMEVIRRALIEEEACELGCECETRMRVERRRASVEVAVERRRAPAMLPARSSGARSQA